MNLRDFSLMIHMVIIEGRTIGQLVVRDNHVFKELLKVEEDHIFW